MGTSTGQKSKITISDYSEETLLGLSLPWVLE